MKAMIDRSVAVLGTGRYLPERTVTNDALRDLCSNYDESASGDFCTWVDRVSHITQRRFIEDGETAARMGAEAALQALDMAGVKPGELDLIILASFTPSTAVPGDHVILADLIGAGTTANFTLTGACAGSIKGMALAQGMLSSGLMRRILVVGAETISPTLDFSDPLTAILFGDGAGAVVMGRVEGGKGGFLPPYLRFDHSAGNIRMGNANLPFSSTVVTPANNGNPPAIQKTYLKMTGGRSVLRNAVNRMAESVQNVLGVPDGSPAGGELDELRARLRVVPHQANGRIVDGLTKKLGLDRARMIKTIYHFANVSAASNLMALDFTVRKGNFTAEHDPETEAIRDVTEVSAPLERGEVVVLPSIGAGYLYGAVGFVY